MNTRLPLLLVLALALTPLAPLAVQAESAPARRIGVYDLGMRPLSFSPPADPKLTSPFKSKVDEAIDAAAKTELHNADELANAFKYIDNISKNNGSLGASLGKACDWFSFTLATAKVIRAHQLDQQSQVKRTTYTAVKEYGKWGVGTLLGGLVAGAIVTLSASNPFTAVMVATYAAWGTTTVVENTLDRIAVNYFDPLQDTKRFGPLDPRMVQWLGARAKNGLTLDIRTKHLEVRPEFIPENMLPTKAVEIIRTAQENCIRRAGDLLDLKPTPFGPMKYDKQLPIDELADRIPWNITSEEQLIEFVDKRAQTAIYTHGRGAWTGEPTEALQKQAYFDRAYPYILRAWKERRDALERLLQRLKHEFETTSLDLTISPEEPEIDPTTGKAVIHFTLGGQGIGDALTKARRIERALTGKQPTVACSVRWTGTSEHGSMDQSAEWPKGGSWWTSVTKPGWVTFGYAATISLNYPTGSRWEMVSKDSIPIEVTGEERLVRTFVANRLDGDSVGKVSLTIQGTSVAGSSDTRFEPPDRTGELTNPNKLDGSLSNNVRIILSEALRGRRSVIQYRGTFDATTSTVRGTATLRTGMKDGPLAEPQTGTFHGTLRGDMLSVTVSIHTDPQAQKPWTTTFQLREQPPAPNPTPAAR